MILNYIFIWLSGLQIFLLKKRNIYLFMIFILIIYSGLRIQGHDYETYKLMYDYIELSKVDIGYYYFVKVFKAIKISYNQFIFITACLIILGPAFFIKKYSRLPVMSLYLYFPTYFILYNYGVIRQGIAISFFLFSLHFLIQGKNKKYFLLGVLATSFHKTAIIFLIIFLFRNKKIKKSTQYVCILLLTPLLFMPTKKFLETIYLIFDYFNIKYNNYFENSTYNIPTGLSIGYFFRWLNIFLEDKNYSLENIIIGNTYFIGVILYLIFSGVEIVSGRGIAYFKILDIIILPNFIERQKNKSVKLFLVFFVIFYGIILFYINCMFKTEIYL